MEITRITGHLLIHGFRIIHGEVNVITEFTCDEQRVTMCQLPAGYVEAEGRTGRHAPLNDMLSLRKAITHAIDKWNSPQVGKTIGFNNHYVLTSA